MGKTILKKITVTLTRSERAAKRRHKRKHGPAALRRAERRKHLQHVVGELTPENATWVGPPNPEATAELVKLVQLLEADKAVDDGQV